MTLFPDLTLAPYELWRRSEELFSQRDYLGAARALESLLESTQEDAPELAQVRELLVRSYYHSARIDRAVAAARLALQHDPGNAYLVLLLARSLERRGDSTEAAAHLRVAGALGLLP